MMICFFIQALTVKKSWQKANFKLGSSTLFSWVNKYITIIIEFHLWTVINCCSNLLIFDWCFRLVLSKASLRVLQKKGWRDLNGGGNVDSLRAELMSFPFDLTTDRQNQMSCWRLCSSIYSHAYHSVQHAKSPASLFDHIQKSFNRAFNA